MVLSDCNPSQKTENTMFHNPDTLTCVSTLLIEFLFFPIKVNAGKIKCRGGRHRLFETYILSLMEL